MKQFLSVGILIMALAMFAPLAKAQGTVRSGPDPSTLRDPELEKDSMHNLEVARNYFKLKKAYVAALKRTEEIIAGNPTFTRIDEALFMAGSSSLFLAEKKGKQDPTLYITYDGNTKKTLTAEEFREMGRDYLSRLVQEYPDSSFRSQAEDALRTVGGPKKQ
jgi:outer membrane protein assembly factor BamD (BamD/ComL family)